MRNAGVLDDEVDPEIERMALALRRPVDLGVDVDRTVMGAIRAAPLMVAPGAGHAARPAAARPARRGGWQWLVRPRPVRLAISPLGAMAAAAVALVAALFGLRGVAARSASPADRYAATDEFPVVKGTAPAAAARPTDTVYVTKFVLVAPGARQVALVGDFNDWDHGRTPLRRVANGDGVWTVDIPLAAGTHKYSFLVDGTEWLADPNAARAADDDFGQPSSVVTVEARRS